MIKIRKKKSSWLIHFIVLTFASAANNSNAEVAVNNLGLESSIINQISIQSFPKRFETIKTTDTNQISLIIDYLNSIKLVKTNVIPQRAYGGGYLIKLFFKDKSTRILSHSGNSWLIEKSKPIYKMKYEDAKKIDPIIAEIIEHNLEKSQVPSIEGSIVSIRSLPSGRQIYCVIKDKENRLKESDIKKALVVDATENGGMILHENDYVKIFSKKENKPTTSEFPGEMIIIKKKF